LTFKITKQTKKKQLYYYYYYLLLLLLPPLLLLLSRCAVLSAVRVRVCVCVCVWKRSWSVFFFIKRKQFNRWDDMDLIYKITGNIP
jgi:hypothetical protein